MSVWGDIRKRSNGTEIKKEDKVENIKEDLTSPVTFVGNIDQKEIDNATHQCGKMYYVGDHCSANGVSYSPGDIIIDDGSVWHKISGHDIWSGDYYIGQ